MVNKYTAKSKLVATQRGLSSRLSARFAAPQTTQAAARVTGSVVAINGRFYPGNITDDTATVTNIGRPAAPLYSAANSGSAVTLVRGSGGDGGGGSGDGSVGVHDLGGSAHQGTLPWSRLNFTGSSLNSIQSRPHSELGALTTTDDHTQYVHNTIARTITARHTFNPATVGAPFTLGTNALAQLVTGLNAQYVGGQLESAFMRRSATSDLNLNGYRIYGNDADTYHNFGRSFIGSNGVADGAAFGHRDYRSTSGYALRQQGTTGNTSLNTPTGGTIYLRQNDGVMESLGDDVHIIYSAVTLRTDHYASQTTGWGVTYGGAGDFRYLYTDEMHAKSFIADLEQALAGGQIISKSVAILSRTFTAPAAGAATTLYVKDLPSADNMAVFQSGDIVRLRKFSRASGTLSITNCWGVVTSYSDLADGEQSWTFTRSSGADAGAINAGGTVNADAIVLDYGTTGNGFYEVNAIDGAYGVNSPYMQIVTWDTHPNTGSTVRVRVGNLTGVGFTGEYGLYAAGGATGAQYLKASDVDFVIAAGPAGSTTIDENGVNIEIGTSFDDDESYTFSSSGTAVSRYSASKTVSSISAQLHAGAIASNDALMFITAEAETAGKYADTYVGSYHADRPSNPARLRFYADDTVSEITAYGSFMMDVDSNNVCFAAEGVAVASYTNIYMASDGDLYAKFPGGVERKLAAVVTAVTGTTVTTGSNWAHRSGDTLTAKLFDEYQVEVTGILDGSGTPSTTIATLPVAYRPTKRRFGIVIVVNGGTATMGRVDIETDGDIVAQNWTPVTGDAVCFELIYFL